jgi:hypothetical protein
LSPTVFREDGYRFFFFSREESRRQVHVVSGDGEAKFWLEPEVALARNHGLRGAQLRRIQSIVEPHYDELIAAWDSHFS